MPKKGSDTEPGTIYVHMSGPLAVTWERSRAKAEEIRESLRKSVEESDLAWEVVARRAGMSPQELEHVLRAPRHALTLGELDRIVEAAEIDPPSFFAEFFQLREKGDDGSPPS